MKMPSSMALLLILGLLCCSWAAGLDFQDDAQFLEELHRLKPWKPDRSSSPKKPLPSKPVPGKGPVPVPGKVPGKGPVPIPMNNGGLVAPLTRINMRGSSVPKFVVELKVGNPAVPLNFSIDTMGHQTAIPSQLCNNAIPSSSKSNKPALPTNAVPCTHPVCKGSSFTCDRIRKRCIAFDRYSNKPLDLVTTQLTLQKVYSSGAAAEETRTLGGLVVGCSAADAVPFTSTNVVSLSPVPTSLVSQLSSMANLPRKFAYCLGKPRGAFFVGSADYVFRQRNITAKLQYFPMLTSTSTWQRGQGYRLALSGIAVGSSSSALLPIHPSEFNKGIIIGTKARYTSLVEVAYKVVRKHFMRVAMASGPAIAQVPSPFPELNLCYRLPPGASVTGAPKIYFTFEGNSTLTVEPRNYIVRWRNTDVVCLGIVSAGPLGRVSVIGTLQQEEMVVEFDLDNNRVGISEQLTRTGNSCQYFDFAPWTFEPPSPRTGANAAAPAPAASSRPAPTSSQPAATPSSSRIVLMEDADSPSAAERTQEDSTAPIGEITGTPMFYPIDQVATSPAEQSYSIDQVAASPTGQSSLGIDQAASSPAGVYRMKEQTAMPPVGPSSLRIHQVAAASPAGPSFEADQAATSPASFRVDQVASSPVGSAFGMSEQVATPPAGSSSFSMEDQVATSPVGSFYMDAQAPQSSLIRTDQVASSPVGAAYRMSDQVAPSSFRIDQVAASPVGPASKMDRFAASPMAFGMSEQVATPPVGSSSFRIDQVATSPVGSSSFRINDQVASSPIGAAYQMSEQIAMPPVASSSLRIDQVAASPVGTDDVASSPNAGFSLGIDQVATSPVGQPAFSIDQVATSPVGAASRMSEQIAMPPVGPSPLRSDQIAASPVGPSFKTDQVAASPIGTSSLWLDQVATSPVGAAFGTSDQVATPPVGSTSFRTHQVATSPVGSSYSTDQVATSPVGSTYRIDQIATSPVVSSFLGLDQVATSPVGAAYDMREQVATSPVGAAYDMTEQVATPPVGAAYDMTEQVATPPVGPSSLRVDKEATSQAGSAYRSDQVAAFSPNAGYGMSEQTATAPAGSSSFRIDQVATSPSFAVQIEQNEQVATSPADGASFEIDQLAASPAGASSIYTRDQVATSPAGSVDHLRKGAISPVGSSFKIDPVAA